MPGPRGGSAESSLRQQGSLISPFSVSPSGSKPGREGSPTPQSTLPASQLRWPAPCERPPPPPPPQEGGAPL